MGTLAVEGYNPVEANAHGVVVQDKPAVAGATGSFQSAFVAKSKNDPNIAEKKRKGMVAIAASLSHSHVSFTLRNVLGDKRGCECSTELAVAGKRCTCPNSLIVDENGNYSLPA